MPPARTFPADQIAWLRKQDAAGVSRSEIARTFTATFGVPITRQQVARLLPPLSPKAANGELIRVTLQLSPEAAASARKLAAALGYTTSRGPDVGEGNLSALNQAIGDGEVEVIPRK